MAFTYRDIKKKILKHRVAGILIIVLVSLSTVISLLKMLYYSSSGTDQVAQFLDQPIRQIVEFLYKHTHPFLEYFWKYSPTPSPKNLIDMQNGYFLAIYLMSFIGIAYLASARDWSRRLREIDKQIQDEMIKASITGHRIRQRQEIEDSIPIDRDGLPNQFHTLYLAPIIVGITIAAMTKLMGLT